ncbi:hypothetical protein OZN48_10315 [Chryseobacterium indologenes]|uniref:hypothetical protein n=1 Tax=Chryseobacterium indologenes TaxID=253 RepID=UPI002D7FFD29|nr:hypothetical protein [Chryseobacterium indologenes]MEB4760880.1 hypothetical protein [Chryseobacterium indologenes]
MSTEEKRERMLSLVEDWKASGLTKRHLAYCTGSTLRPWVTGSPSPRNRKPVTEVLLRCPPDQL